MRGREDSRINYRLATEGDPSPEVRARFGLRAEGPIQRYTVRPPLQRRGPVVPAEPFRFWLAEQVSAIGVANVAAAIGVDGARVRTILSGSYLKGGRQYPVKNLTTAFVERALAAFGQHIQDLYPNHNQGS